MTIPSKLNSGDPSKYQTEPDALDDKSDATDPTGFATMKFEQEMVTKVLKFSFVAPKTQTKQVPPGIVHMHLLHALQVALGEDICIWNNKSEKIEPISLLQWASNPTIHQKQFKIHQKTSGGNGPRRSTKYYIVHRIMTSEPISSIKQIPAIHQILKDNMCYLTEHHWNEDTWDTNKIGFVTKLDPSFYNPDQAHTKFTELLKEKIKKLETRTKIKIPLFRMVFASPKIRNTSNQTISTKAYAIEVKHEDTQAMLQTLKSLLRDTPVFVPFSMRHKFPEGFTKAIKYQTQLLTSTMVIVLQYLHPDMMFHIDEFIKAIDGVIDIMPDRHVIKNGKYRVQVSQEKFKKSREALIQYLPGWCNEYIPDDAYPYPNPFPEAPKVQPIRNDGFSSGENSWMSMSNTSFLSMDLSNVADDDYFSNTTTATKAFTYAEIVLPTKTIIPTNVGTLNARYQDTLNADDETKAALSDITTTAKTVSEHAAQKELEKANELIERQRREIQELREEQKKSNASYENIMAHMNERLIEQETEASTLKNEISTMIIQQQAQHSAEMHELYNRLMTQMASMLNPTIPITAQQPDQDLTELSGSHSHITITSPPLTQEDSQHMSRRQDKRQDTRPSPTKRKSAARNDLSIDVTSNDQRDTMPLSMDAEDTQNETPQEEEDV
jgi:hypothetical protein